MVITIVRIEEEGEGEEEEEEERRKKKKKINAGIFRLGHDSCFRNLFQSIVHVSPYYSTLCSPATKSVVKFFPSLPKNIRTNTYTHKRIRVQRTAALQPAHTRTHARNEQTVLKYIRKFTFIYLYSLPFTWRYVFIALEE
jgi:hypothetical protein